MDEYNDISQVQDFCIQMKLLPDERVRLGHEHGLIVFIHNNL